MPAFTFSTPANIADFPPGSPKDRCLRQLWNWNLTGDTLTSITGDPWNVENDQNRYFYFNPVTTPIPQGAVVVPIQWVAFPNRLLWYFSNVGSSGNPFQLSQAALLELGDTGKVAGNPAFAKGFPPVPTGLAQICPQINWKSDPSTWRTFGPAGPRGWQDEYCEWSVTRDPASGKITSVMFTCENPDYWFTLWQVDPNTVLQIYQRLLGSGPLLCDLYLLDSGGNPVVNPLTGQPAYNPLNKWNSGTVTKPGVSGGAVHLTSPPNTLGAEVYLAAAATLLRQVSPYDPQNMICCSKYGQPFRNSDPHIGFMSNRLVKAGDTISLSNPVGLYIQEPDWGSYKTPDGTSAQDFWNIVRGNGPQQILHAVFEVPAAKGYTVSDITINGQSIQWAGQIAQTFQMQLSATGFSGSSLPPQQTQKCQQPSASPTPQPIILIDNGLLNAYNALYTVGGSVTNSPVLPAPVVRQGQTVNLALQCSDVAVNPTISFGDGISVTINSVGEPHVAAVAGDRRASPLALRTFQLSIVVSASAALGQRSVTVQNPGPSKAIPAPAFLTVVPAEWSCAYKNSRSQTRIVVAACLVLTAVAVAVIVKISRPGGPKTPVSPKPAAVVTPGWPCSSSVPSVTSTIPDDAPVTAQATLNCFAWQEFIALNWAAAPGQRGVADPSVTSAQFGAPSAAALKVWETYKADTEVMLPGAAAPASWNSPPPAPPCTGTRPSVTALLGDPDERVLTMSSAFGDFDLSGTTQASGQWLADQNGKLVWYEIRLNQDEFNTIVGGHFYNADVQQKTASTGKNRFSASEYQVMLPSGCIAGTCPGGDSPRTGAIELKAAWRVLTDPSQYGRYLTAKAILVHGDSSCSTATMGLVGLHIIHKTVTQPQFIWATFEQVDNLSTSSSATFNAAACECENEIPIICFTKPPAQPAYQNCLVSQKKGEQCTPNTTPAYYSVISACPAYPIQVARGRKISDNPSDPVVATNTAAQQLIKGANPNSVFQYYQLVDVLWSGSPQNSYTNQPGTPGPTSPLSMSGATPDPLALPVANATMETYVQHLTCLRCHVSARIAKGKYASDFSFVLEEAQSPGTAAVHVRHHRDFPPGLLRLKH